MHVTLKQKLKMKINTKAMKNVYRDSQSLH